MRAMHTIKLYGQMMVTIVDVWMERSFKIVVSALNQYWFIHFASIDLQTHNKPDRPIDRQMRIDAE